MTTITEPQVVDTDQLPPGLLSFIYNVLHNPAVNELFFSDIKSLMHSFALTDDQQEAILNSMDHGKAMPADAQVIGGLLAKDLEDNFTTYYAEFW